MSNCQWHFCSREPARQNHGTDHLGRVGVTMRVTSIKDPQVNYSQMQIIHQAGLVVHPFDIHFCYLGRMATIIIGERGAHSLLFVKKQNKWSEVGDRRIIASAHIRHGTLQISNYRLCGIGPHVRFEPLK